MFHSGVRRHHPCFPSPSIASVYTFNPSLSSSHGLQARTAATAALPLCPVYLLHANLDSIFLGRVSPSGAAAEVAVASVPHKFSHISLVFSGGFSSQQIAQGWLLASAREMEKLEPFRCAFLLVLALVALPSVQGVEKVKVELYSESLCPGCSEFIVNFLNPFFNNGLIDIVELRIIPYGNARVLDGKFVCQHGPDECELNIIQTCAIRLWPKVTDWFPFIYCLESLDRSTAAQNWKSCVHPSHLDLDPLLECSASPLGAKLEMEFAAETDRLQPPHTYVPWVLVNGEPLTDYYEDVAAYVCKAYQGNKPAVCSRLELEILKTKPARVCARENVLLASY